MKLNLLILVLAPVLALGACTSTSKHESRKAFEIPAPVAVSTADIVKGTKTAREGTPSGATACVGCHGSQGEGLSASGFPRLAGQPQMYLNAQLQAYRDGRRSNSIMSGIAKAMSEQESQDVAAYYESLSGVPFAKAAALTGARAKRGAELASWGDQKLGLQSCQNCHGPGGIGEGPSIPYLRGQIASYTVAQLNAWKTGTRKNNPEHMGYIAKLLPQADIETLAAFYQHVPNGEKK